MTREERIYGSFYETFNNAPLIAALGTKNDPAIRQFVGMVSLMAKGVPANNDDQSVLVWLKAAVSPTLLKDLGYTVPDGTDTYTPGDPKANVEIFYDDFSNTGTGWLVDRSRDEGTAYNGGEYEVRIFKKTMYSYSAPVKTTIPARYLVQTDARVTMGANRGYYALVFNLQGWDSFYYLLVVDPSRQSYTILKSERGNLRTLLDWTNSSLINASGKNTLTAWVDGNRAAAFINGKAVTEWFDLGDVASPPKARVSASNFAGLFAVNVRFDNFMVIGNPQ